MVLTPGSQGIKYLQWLHIRAGPAKEDPGECPERKKGVEDALLACESKASSEVPAKRFFRSGRNQ
jgi:hypothetical protein